MDFTLTADRAALATALDGLAARFEQTPTDFRGFALVSEELEQELAAAEFFDIAATPELGPVAAAATVERLARLPYCAEVALSMLVRPRLSAGEWPRPLALVQDGRPGRFVASAKTVLVADGDKLGVALLSPDAVQAVPSIYAYPMGRLTRAVATQPLSPSEAADVRKWLRIALAAEAAGLMQAGIDVTVEHLSVRKQFGRPLGSFQALRHRLAECAVLAGREMAGSEGSLDDRRGRRRACGLSRPGERHPHHLRSTSDARRDGDDPRASATSLDLSPEGPAFRSRRPRRAGAGGRPSLLQLTP